MADTKISDLTVISALADADKIPIADMGGGPDSRGVLVSQLRNFLTPRGYIWGLRMANDAGDTANDIEVQPGEAMAESHDEVMTLSAIITKRLDAAWTVGDNQGGLNTGGEAANTWYEVHLIKRTDTGVVDVMFTTTANRATLPANYTKQRRIGWIRNDGSSNILQFTQVEDYFTLTTQLNDVAVTPTATATAVTLTAPPNTIARFRASIFFNAIADNAELTTVFSEIVEGNVTPAIATGISSLSASGGNTTAANNAGAAAGHFELRLSSSSQIEHDSVLGGSIAGHTLDISTFGWIDRRRRIDEF